MFTNINAAKAILDIGESHYTESLQELSYKNLDEHDLGHHIWQIIDRDDRYNLAEIKYATDRGGDINYQNGSIIQAAIMEKLYDIVEYLLSKGAHVDWYSTMQMDKTIIDIYIRMRGIDAKYHILRYASINKWKYIFDKYPGYDEDKMFRLFCLLLDESLVSVMAMLEFYPTHVNRIIDFINYNPSYNICAHWICSIKCKDTLTKIFVKYMLSYNTDVDTVRFLVSRGADINVHNGLPLRLAAISDNVEVVKWLMANGANPPDEYTLRKAGPDVRELFFLNAETIAQKR